MGGAFEFPVKLCCNSEEEVEEREDNADAIDGFANKHNFCVSYLFSRVTNTRRKI